VVLLLSCYYFSADNGRVRAGMLAVLPVRVREKLPALRERASWFARRYLRAYLLLWLITFAEMFLGLSILGIPYAFLLAILIAVVDFLPVLGTGTVLIPWAACSLLTGNQRTGFGLLILYGVSVIVREVAEPRLVGAQLGIHPLLSLFAMYAGLRFFGLPGMLLSPVFAICLRFLLSDETGGEKGPPG
jgi:sporulation integral membrane protein YtvI